MRGGWIPLREAIVSSHGGPALACDGVIRIWGDRTMKNMKRGSILLALGYHVNHTDRQNDYIENGNVSIVTSVEDGKEKKNYNIKNKNKNSPNIKESKV